MFIIIAILKTFYYCNWLENPVKGVIFLHLPSTERSFSWFGLFFHLKLSIEITTAIKIRNNQSPWLSAEFSVFSDHNTWLMKHVLLAVLSFSLLVSLKYLVLVFQHCVVWRRKRLFWCQFKVVIRVWNKHVRLCSSKTLCDSHQKAPRQEDPFLTKR